MKEEFLQNLWKNKVFNPIIFKDTDGNPIEILDFGILNKDAGPDFHSAKIRTQNLVFFGNIEIHKKSSDWYLHKHHNQKEYESIILHIVFEHDKNIPELKNKNIPTIELKKYIDPKILASKIFRENAKFIPCEELFNAKSIPTYILEELVLQKLEDKNKEIKLQLKLKKNDYEAVLFEKIAYTFGLKVNADTFLQIAQDIDFKIIKKVLQNQFQLESLLLGKADLLDDTPQTQQWKQEYNFLKTKFRLNDIHFPVKFFRLRPFSFPTIRLSQLANLYSSHINLFSKVINAQTLQELKTLFKNIKTSEYWENHFIFGKETPRKAKVLSSDFIDIILINALFPIIYSYHENNTDIHKKILSFYKGLKPERNSITEKWQSIGVEMNSALHSQAFLYLYKNFCTQKKCNNCHQIKTL